MHSADGSSVLLQSGQLESKMNSKRIEQMCCQLSGLLSLLVQMQAIQGPAGQPKQHESACLAAAADVFSRGVQNIFLLSLSDELSNLQQVHLCLLKVGQFL